MRHTNEHDPVHSWVRVEDQCPLNYIVGRELSVEPICIALENSVPEHALGRYSLHLGKQAAHAVANEHHVLGFGIELIDLRQTFPELERGQRNRIARRLGKNPELITAT